ncbi:hypothetical protein C8R43DRAFT_1240185 [Mycena crocata]|nr:hypothetical protein C8R43DRAFT_1240185 [Mycena crocata]
MATTTTCIRVVTPVVTRTRRRHILDTPPSLPIPNTRADRRRSQPPQSTSSTRTMRRLIPATSCSWHFKCCPTETATWRGSKISAGELLCNKSGIFEPRLRPSSCRTSASLSRNRAQPRLSRHMIPPNRTRHTLLDRIPHPPSLTTIPISPRIYPASFPGHRRPFRPIDLCRTLRHLIPPRPSLLPPQRC